MELYFPGLKIRYAKSTEFQLKTKFRINVYTYSTQNNITQARLFQEFGSGNCFNCTSTFWIHLFVVRFIYWIMFASNLQKFDTHFAHTQPTTTTTNKNGNEKYEHCEKSMETISLINLIIIIT